MEAKANKLSSKSTSEHLRRNVNINKKKSVVKRFLFAFVLCITIIVLFLFLANRYIFKIAKIDVSENHKYTYEEILESGGISVGMELYSLRLSEISQNIKDNLAYVKTAKLIQIPPSTLKINISLEKGMLAIKLGGDYYILSENFKVLEKISSTERSDKDIVNEMLENNIIIFNTHTIKECYVGKKVKFHDDDISEFLRKLLISIEKNQIYGSINEINIINKFDVKINYSNKFLVKIGNFEDIDTKILSLIKMVNQLHEDDKGEFESKGEIERIDETTWAFTYNDKIFN